jgi:hypothetical protein
VIARDGHASCARSVPGANAISANAIPTDSSSQKKRSIAISLPIIMSATSKFFAVRLMRASLSHVTVTADLAIDFQDAAAIWMIRNQ